MSVELDDSVSPAEKRRAEVHRERAEAIEALRDRIKTLEEREPELKQEIVEFEKSQRATISELEKTLRTTVSELEKSHRSAIVAIEQTLRTKPDNAEELEQELERKRDEFDEELERTRDKLTEKLESTRDELAEQLARLRAEFAAIKPAVVDARCTLGMKMSDFALEEHEGHEQAIEYLQPLLVELRKDYSRALSEAKRNADEADEKLKALAGEHHITPEESLPLVEQRFQPLIDAEGIGATVEQAKTRLARHRLALLDSEDGDPDPNEKNARLTRELALEAAMDELDAARGKIAALVEEKRVVVHHYSHPTAEKSKALGKQFAKRFGRHH
jgi:DNA repair exonuclease SbcCD ATPase subunit